MTTAMISADRTWDIASSSVFKVTGPFTTVTSVPVNGLAFYVDIPKGTTLEPRNSSLASCVKVNEDDEKITYKVTYLVTFNTTNNAATCSDLLLVNFAGAYNNNVGGTTYDVKTYGVDFNIKSFDYSTSAFTTKTVKGQDEVTAKVYVSVEFNNDLYAPGYGNTSGQVEQKNTYTGNTVSLYYTRRFLDTTRETANGVSDTIACGTSGNVMYEYEALKTDDGEYLDNVTSLYMGIPFLGKEGSAQYTAQLEKVTIWYEGDTTGTVLDIEAFRTRMLNGDITFNIVLPTGVTLDSIDGIEFSYDRSGTKLNYATDETIGDLTVVSETIGQDEAQEYFGIYDNSIVGATVYTCTLNDTEAVLYGIRAGAQSNAFAKMSFLATVTPNVRQPETLLPWSKVIALGSNSTAYTSFAKITGNSNVEVGTGESTANYTGALKIGNTANIVTGSSDQYMYIVGEPALMVHDLATEYNGVEYKYADTNTNTIPVMYRNETGSIKYTITNTVTGSAANEKESYVFFHIPSIKGSNSELVNAPGSFFDTEAAGSYSAEVDTMMIKVENLESFEGFDVEIEFVTPNHKTEGIEYLEIYGKSKYYFSGTSMTEYSSKDAQELIKIGYTNPEWPINIKGEQVNGEGYILGELSLVNDEYKVLHGQKIYKEGTIEDSDDSFEEGDIILTPENVTGHTFVEWYSDAELTTPFFGNNDSVVITSETTIYAKYEVNKITVTYVLNNGDEDSVSILDWTSAFTRHLDPVKPVHTLVIDRSIYKE